MIFCERWYYTQVSTKSQSSLTSWHFAFRLHAWSHARAVQLCGWKQEHCGPTAGMSMSRPVCCYVGIQTTQSNGQLTQQNNTIRKCQSLWAERKTERSEPSRKSGGLVSGSRVEKLPESMLTIRSNLTFHRFHNSSHCAVCISILNLHSLLFGNTVKSVIVDSILFQNFEFEYMFTDDWKPPRQTSLQLGCFCSAG